MMKNKIKILSIILFININTYPQVKSLFWTQDQLSNATIYLHQQINDSTGKAGSGTIIYHENRYFLLTASHVAKDMQQTAKVVFRLKDDKPLIYPLLKLTKGNLLNWNIHPVADIAIIEISPIEEELKTLIRDSSFPINQIHGNQKLPSREADLTFLGFPILDLELEHFSPLIFTGYLASGLITQRRYDTHTKCNFFFLNVPSIQGCSGAGVFFSVKKDFYYKGEQTLLIGIVHGTKGDNTGGKLAAITPSYYIDDLLKKY